MDFFGPLVPVTVIELKGCGSVFGIEGLGDEFEVAVVSKDAVLSNSDTFFVSNAVSYAEWVDFGSSNRSFVDSDAVGFSC